MNTLLFLDFTIFGWNPWYVFSVLFAFPGMISFFQVDSAWADKIGAKSLANGGSPKRGNRMFIVVGVILTLLSLFCMIMANNTSTGTGG